MGEFLWVVEKLSVVKFGGSSLRNSFWEAVWFVRRLAEGGSVVVVVSALGGVTEKLIRLSRGNDGELLEEILLEHSRLAGELGADVDAILLELSQALSLPPGKEREEYILSFGERLSSVLFARALEIEGIPSAPVDARGLLALRGTFGRAEIDFKASLPGVKRLKELSREIVPVVTGFIGSLNGKTATLGRGGSDYTASALGAMLGARAVLIMSDVGGIYTADPKLVPGAKLIPFLPRERALLASRLGMKALHPKALEPPAKVPLLLGKTEDWYLGTLVTNFGENLPIVTHRVRGNRGEIAVVGVDDVPGWEGRGGNGYFTVQVPRDELPKALNEIHGVVISDVQGSGDNSELWARV